MQKVKEDEYGFFKNNQRLIPFNRFPKINFDKDADSNWVWVEIGENQFEAFEKSQCASYEKWLIEVNSNENIAKKILDNCNTSVALKVQ